MQDSSSNRSKGKFYIIALLVGAFLYLGSTFVYSFSTSVVIKSLFPTLETLEGEIYNSYLSIVQLLFGVPLIGLAIFVLWDDLKRDFIDLKNNFVKHRTTIIVGIVGCLVLTTVVSEIYYLLGITGESDNQEIINNVLLGPAWWPMVISVVFVAPFIEEILFRKLLCGVCTETCKLSKWVAIAVSTVIFALIHVADIENLIFIFQYLPLAFVITYSYFHSENIFVPIGIHFLNNLASVVLLYIGVMLGI